MAFDWTQYLTLAQELAGRSDEAALRCAIGRAYYAVFCLARNRWIQEHGVIPLDVNVHNFIWNEYLRANRLGRFIGQDGFRLLNYRNKADYDDEFPDVIPTAQSALTIAQKTLNNLANF